MTGEQIFAPLKTFVFESREQPVTFVETTTEVADGVDCDVYKFDGDESKDLGIIRIKPGKKTPLQRVKLGDRTVEGFVSGKGKLMITKQDGTKIVYQVDDEEKTPFVVDVQIGELMQWEAAPGEKLVAYEICFPPYEDGRYENIQE
ncbi:hypothetical protein A3I57_00180 [Candidatus Beckwithbacteria bacterium RIFCSPLOWO2_02_FULL_47_23]|uniref:Uncharacterized protein n=1 Tax=Candidatus Beckwithbacteria bacterium RIFCSPLOWO2_02_FULL_47_23 TaxID=1797463 RepID=A0A1F5DRV1_9BACT|nr:MAG: hypothetical protein A3I57_00180 [Candidatus Beckwithbacteria bacterium RIFCSPLOWO2_02_FULL_47_23]